MPNSTRHLYQIYYLEPQIAHLDPGFKPWSNLTNPEPDWAEVRVILDAGKEFEQNFAELTGFFSWRFKEKFGIGAKEVNEFIDENPGYDCYIFNPFAFATALHRNVWLHGEECHPGLLSRSQDLVDELGWPFILQDLVDYSGNCAYTNSWVANQDFFKDYLIFIEKLYQLIHSKKDKLGSVWETVTYRNSSYRYIPFIIERMFGLFLRLHPHYKTITYMDTSDLGAIAHYVEIADWLKQKAQDDVKSEYYKKFVSLRNLIMDMKHELSAIR